MNLRDTMTCSMKELRNNASVGFSFNLTSSRERKHLYATTPFIIDSTKKGLYGWVWDDSAEREFLQDFDSAGAETYRVIYANVLEFDNTEPEERTLLELYFGMEWKFSYPSNDRENANIRYLLLENHLPEKVWHFSRRQEIVAALRRNSVLGKDL